MSGRLTEAYDASDQRITRALGGNSLRWEKMQLSHFELLGLQLRHAIPNSVFEDLSGASATLASMIGSAS